MGLVKIALDRVAIDDDDASIRAALDDADVVPLLPAVAELTGDYSLVRPELRPDPARLLEPGAGLTPDDERTARDLAARALARFRDAGSEPASPPAPEQVRDLLAFVVGDGALSDYTEMLLEELQADEDRRAPGWRRVDLRPQSDLSVAIVGAGMSGLLMAHRLQQAEVPFTIFEKNDDVGGTWFENVYPGCRVDVPNHLYSYSFAQTSHWPGFYSTQDVLLDYFRTCAAELELRPHVEFRTEVVSTTFDEDGSRWSVVVRGPDGVQRTERFGAVVSAVGQLNRPRLPDIPGRDRFRGTAFHSAEWDPAVDLKGKRVAVIGTGASAEQLVPAIVSEVGELELFQRTPPWIMPSPNYGADIPPGLRWLLDRVPGYARWDRLWWFWRTHEGFLPMASVDPDYQGEPGAVSEANERVRGFFTAFLRHLFPDDDLFEAVLPPYPPFAKRVLRDDGAWAAALTHPNLRLVREPIVEVSEAGVVTADGDGHAVDVIVYATGFHASKFLTPMKVTGRGGLDLHQHWEGDARAYLGMTVPGFPNFFVLYGPNTNIVANGSIIFFSECEVHYVMGCLRLLLESEAGALDCRPEVYEEYARRIDDANRRMVWGYGEVRSWYRNEKGRVTQNWPFSMLEYWQLTRAPDPADYVLT
jgi:4-hydroxyacetophenone monooxygenase